MIILSAAYPVAGTKAWRESDADVMRPLRDGDETVRPRCNRILPYHLYCQALCEFRSRGQRVLLLAGRMLLVLSGGGLPIASSHGRGEAAGFLP